MNHEIKHTRKTFSKSMKLCVSGVSAFGVSAAAVDLAACIKN